MDPGPTRLGEPPDRRNQQGRPSRSRIPLRRQRLRPGARPLEVALLPAPQRSLEVQVLAQPRGAADELLRDRASTTRPGARSRCPSNIEMQGYAPPVYVNIGYAWGWNAPPASRWGPTTSARSTPTSTTPGARARRRASRTSELRGSYRHRFEVPASWQGRACASRSRASSAGFYLWVNGKKVGYSEDSRGPAEFDITDFVRPGENLLAAEVYRFTDGSYLECQDFWRMSGIFRDVVLWSTAPVHVADLRVVTDLDAPVPRRHAEARRHASRTRRRPSRRSPSRRRCSTPAGKPVGADARRRRAPGRGPVGPSPSRRRGRTRSKWSDEKPNLYTLLVTLKDAAAGSLDVVPDARRLPEGRDEGRQDPRQRRSRSSSAA